MYKVCNDDEEDSEVRAGGSLQINLICGPMTEDREGRKYHYKSLTLQDFMTNHFLLITISTKQNRHSSRIET